MMKMNAGIWIGIVGGAIGLIVGLASVLSVGGTAGPIISLVMLVVFGGMFYLFYRLFFKPMINANRLQKVGIPGKARILEVRDTGVTINNNPQIKLMLEVKNNFGQKYNTQCRVLVSRINPNAYMPGMEVPVKIDPKNEQNVVIDFGGSATASNFQSPRNNTAINETALKADLEQMQKDNDAIRLSGRSARAIVKKYNWEGAYVNGNNPYVELEVEVLPENSPAFAAKLKGVIAEASVSKFQPGEEIMVKYDYYDNSKVAIEHS
jgi:hypothetical protein